jgi:hypothetical protein
VPHEYLSDEQAAAGGRYTGVPSPTELDKVFFLDDEDRKLVGRRRGPHMKLGFALQPVTVRYVGLFLEDPLDVPTEVLEFVAGQLDIADPSCVKRYTERDKTRFDHAWEIQRAYGLKDFAAAEDELREWVAARSWTSGDGPKAIFGDAVRWLRERDVLLPGVTTLVRLAAGVRASPSGRCASRYCLLRRPTPLPLHTGHRRPARLAVISGRTGFPGRRPAQTTSRMLRGGSRRGA